MSAFFTLHLESASKQRKILFDQIHEIVFYGKGGYDWETAYNLPTWLRNYTHNKIFEHYKNENEAVKNANKPSDEKTVIDSDGNVKLPSFLKKAKKFSAK